MASATKGSKFGIGLCWIIMKVASMLAKLGYKVV